MPLRPINKHVQSRLPQFIKFLNPKFLQAYKVTVVVSGILGGLSGATFGFWDVVFQGTHIKGYKIVPYIFGSIVTNATKGVFLGAGMMATLPLSLPASVSIYVYNKKQEGHS